MELRLVCRAGTLSACARINLILSLMFFVPLQLYALFCSEIVALFQTLQRCSSTHTNSRSHIHTSTGTIVEGGSDLWRRRVSGGGGGDSHSVDLHSVTRLKERAEKEHREWETHWDQKAEEGVSCEGKLSGRVAAVTLGSSKVLCTWLQMFSMESFYSSKGKPGRRVYHEWTEGQLKGEWGDRLGSRR